MSRLILVGLAALVAFLVACDGDDGGDPFQGTQPATATATQSATGESTPTSTADRPETPATEAPPSPSPTPTSPASGLPEVQLQRVFEGLSFERMTGMYQAPDGSWFVTEQPGRISRFSPSGEGGASLVLDITNRVLTGGNEEGLLGFALSPAFEADGAFYAYYSAPNPRRSVISRFRLGDGDVAATEEVILEVEQPFANHNAGQIGFGPDGYLYVALGDGGGGSDPNNNAQNLGTLLGSILRIDVSGAGAGYDVPDDNPFVGTQGARGEIWAHGFRNPWRFSFDRETGELWVGDVGQNSREEVDLVVRGGNYGWREMEGFGCRGGGSGCNPDAFLPPVFDYTTGSGGTCSVTGGFVYRGTAIPGLRGAYVFSDYCSGVIYALRQADGVLTEQGVIAESGFRISSLAQDNEGELYVLQHSGMGGIYKLVP